MLKVYSNRRIVQYVDYMRGPIKERGPERLLRLHPIRSITVRNQVGLLKKPSKTVLALRTKPIAKIERRIIFIYRRVSLQLKASSVVMKNCNNMVKRKCTIPTAAASGDGRV